MPEDEERHELCRTILNDCCSFEVDRRGNVLNYELNEANDCCDTHADM